MKKNISLLLVLAAIGTTDAMAEMNSKDTLNEVVVTGTRNAADVRHLPMTVSVVNRDRLTIGQQMNVLPTVMQQVPGMFVTSRGVFL